MKYIVIIFSLLGKLHAQNTDWHREKLHGKVRSIREISYQIQGENLEKGNIEPLLPNTFTLFNSVGDYLSKERYDHNNQLLETITYTYSKNPPMHEQKCLNAKGIAFLTIISSIDENGNPTDTRYYDEKNNITRNIVQKYNKKNQKIEYRVVDKGVLNERFTYKYNRKGNLTEQYSYFANQQVAQTWFFQYNDDQLLTEIKYFNHKGLLEEIRRFQYNEKKLKTLLQVFDGAENLKKEESFSYDEFLNEIDFSRKEIYPNNTIWNKKQQKYTYDEKGNWTRKIIFINDTPATITEREIVYFL